MQSPYVPPSLAIADHEKFTKFVPSMENFVALLDAYTYDNASKKVSQKIIKRIKFKEDLEEEVKEKHVIHWKHIRKSCGHCHSKLGTS